MYQQYKDTCSTASESRGEVAGSQDHSDESLSQELSQKMSSLSSEQTWSVEDKIKEEWLREQKTLKEKMIIGDLSEWAQKRVVCEKDRKSPIATPLRFIGGVDISFIKGDQHNACAAFVVLEFPELNVVYEDLQLVKLTAPYIAGFLAFREVHFCVEQIEKLRKNKPQYEPQVIVVDGNGIHHPLGFGMACHLGVLADIAAIGASKNLLHVDGLEKGEKHSEQISSLQKPGDSFPLIGESGQATGMAVLIGNSTKKPIYVSPGHKVSIETAAWVTSICSKYRVPEPTRQADIRSREFLRQHWKGEDT